MKFLSPSTACLLAMGSTFVDARGYGSLLAPRNYHYNRLNNPFDLVSEFFSTPFYSNSLMLQQAAAESRLARSAPRYWIAEENGVIELSMEVPGVLAKDLEVELEGDELIRIKGTRKRSTGGSVESFDFDQSFRLAEDIDVEQLTVNLSAGILRIRVPKKEKTVKKLPVVSDVNDEVVEVKPISDINENHETIDGLDITEDA
jgi:HSP20 family molecular chaperone IbpA